MKTPIRPAPARACRQKPSRRLISWILEVQDYRCFGCEEALDRVELDHIIPLGLGGSNAPDNWAALCVACHRRKTRVDLQRIAKAKRQRRYHETGRSRAPRSTQSLPGIGASRGFDRTRKRCLNGMVSVRCGCPKCTPRSRERNDEA